MAVFLNVVFKSAYVPTSTISHVNLNLTTLYQSPYMTINDEGYTKHYYTESDRIASRIGGGFKNSLVGLGDNVEGIGEFHYGTFANTLYTNLVEDIACVGLGEEYIVYEAPLGIIDELSGKNLSENDVYFYHKDHLGSSSYLTDGSGYPTEHRQYMPFGEDMVYEAGSSAYYTPYTFSAKERDMETSFSYFGARYYDAGLSIWLSVDPMSDKYPSLSPYNYCAWNPVMFIDPDGRQIDDYFDKQGNFLFKDNKTTDNIRIIDKKDWKQIQSEFGKEILDAGTSHKNLDQALDSKSTAIEDTKLSGDAVRKIFNNVIGRMPEMDKSKLHNSSVSTYDYLDHRNTTNNGIATGEASTGITKQGKIRISILMTGGYIPVEFNTVSNIQNAIGVHEYLGHGVARIVGDINHYKAYDLQFSHPSWKGTTTYYKTEMMKRYNDYKK